ncbi:MAG: LamG domain-containing protein [Gemmataceae bacterium]|nr:LamG domain-containing protein [Gemmataceae bacterium]
MRFSREGALFDGRTASIEIPSAPGLEVGGADFTLSLWVRTEKDLDDTLGDLISKYDPARRTGLNLTIQHNAGTGSQSNYRNLHFGIDQARQDAAWTDRGRPGKAIFIHSLAVHEGHLYAGTVEGRTNDDHGHVFRYADGEKWEDLGAPWRSNGVTAMASYNGHLYVGVSRVLLHYSGLEPTLAHHIGGKVFRYENGKWIDLGQILGIDGVNGMVVFRGKLYVTGFYQPGMFRYEGGTEWASLGTPEGKRPEGLIVRDGAIYATGYDEGAVYRFDGEKWTHTGRLGDSTQVYGQGIYRGKHLAGTWAFGEVFRHEGDGHWESAGRLRDAEEVMGPAGYNGMFYVGTLPLAEIFRYDGDRRWTSMGRVDTTPDVKYRRAWSMAVFDGKLFAGTLPSGHVWSFEAGRSATYDRELAAGWRHIAAVREGIRLRLHVDGKVVAQSAEFDPGHYDLTNTIPWQIGFGQHDYFNGTARDVRLYTQALSAAEVIALAGKR